MTHADQAELWPVESSTSHFTGHVISVRSDTVRSPADGSTFVRDVVEHPGAVAVVAMDDHSNVLVVAQYRHPVQHRLIELPAGLRDVPGEPPLECAKRELYEEGHVRAAEWQLLTSVFLSPGSMEEEISIYLARGITDVPDNERHTGVHEEADMPVSWVPLDELVAGVLQGKIHNATTCVGVLAASASRVIPVS